MGAGVAQVMGGGCWKMTVSDAVTLFEKFGLETVAVSNPVALLPDVYAGTLTVRVTESFALAARLVVRVQVKVPTVQIQPPVKSVMAVTIMPVGGAIVKMAEL